ncbi:hypothetical protein ASF71_20085 [Deinococcus sp. Leaf326]|nr:hypothetical protein ASF71_20085 [Deinococcus sp. Leaf326]
MLHFLHGWRRNGLCRGVKLTKEGAGKIQTTGLWLWTTGKSREDLQDHKQPLLAEGLKWQQWGYHRTQRAGR